MTARRTSRRQPAQKSPRPPASAPAGPGLAATTGLALGGALGRALTAGGGALVSLVSRAAASPDVRRLVLLGALGAGVAGASDAARRRVEAWPRFEVDRAALALTPLPAALSERARRDLERLPLPPRPRAHDPQLVPFTAACLAGLPWVKEVDAVRLDARGRLGFSLVAREPVARVGQGDEALTSDGAVVPLAYAARPAALPTLDGVPATGDARDRALAAANAVLRQLGDLRAHVVRLDLSNLEGRRDPLQSEVVLTLAQGPRVDWGRPPAPAPADADGEGAGAGDLAAAAPARPRPRADGAAKLEALRRFMESGLDLAQIERVSVRWDEVTYALRAPTPSTEVAAAPARDARRARPGR